MTDAQLIALITTLATVLGGALTLLARALYAIAKAVITHSEQMAVLSTKIDVVTEWVEERRTPPPPTRDVQRRLPTAPLRPP